MNDSTFYIFLDKGENGMWGRDFGADIEWKKVVGWARGACKMYTAAAFFLLLVGQF